MINFRGYILKIFTFLQKDIWRTRLAQKPPGISFLIKYLRVILLSVQSFGKDKCYLRASALTFWSVLSIVPVAALVFGIASGFGLKKILEKQLMGKLPGQEQVLEQIINFSQSLLENTRGGLIAGIGIVILLWTVIKVLDNIEQSLNDIWKISKPRTAVRKTGDYLSLMVICPLFFVLSSSVTVFITTKITYLTEKLSIFEIISPIVFFSFKLIPYLLIWTLFTFIYIIMPNTRVRFVSGAIGGIISGTIYQLLQWGYIKFQVGVSSYNAIYGSFAALPVFLMWLQISWLIVLFGTEISYAHQNIDKYELKPDSDNISMELKRLFTLQIAYILIKNFSMGVRPLSIYQISESLEMPICLVEELINDLVKCRVISGTANEDDNQILYQPAVDINRLTIYYILDALDQKGTKISAVTNTPKFKALSKSMGDLKKTLSQSPANIRLMDL